jgi:hypothetical protein
MELTGHIESGRVVLDGPSSLPDGTPVRVEVVEPPIPSLFEQLQDLVGKVQHLPPDASHQHDHYLYGTPKQP